MNKWIEEVGEYRAAKALGKSIKQVMKVRVRNAKPRKPQTYFHKELVAKQKKARP